MAPDVIASRKRPVLMRPWTTGANRGDTMVAARELKGNLSQRGI